ncbi:Membrane-bound lytic murein transglycosylase A precursor [Rhodobacteraceae bacterium THAF1]|uniref:murein transglycosylase A n=1 Tax=Palleronia sp. THAF1 TaxID=2587842 RepID=UPI000F3EA2D7|nr:MltA domain-containing protein [Palleronia sp. THAF1]QFU10148.1 Membrane-bound lytic murein transglycosylase A precursor [Palleronia sp. THAF1]VDC16947.1 Membrane-bound lytic murein transglycosylase A precursor [Rhodobacteraceae bacterium THAF1]
MRAGLASVFLAIASMTGAEASVTKQTVLEFSDLQGWDTDDHGAALSVFRETCGDLPEPDWRTLCLTAADWTDSPRRFFELHFAPVLIEDGQPMLFTGYYEPELKGSRYRGGAYQHPLYALPDDAPDGSPFLTRAEIDETDALRGRGLEIAYIDDPVDAYFLQVQGSGRVALDDGTAIRVGYAGKNGHPYRSVGQELIARGEMDAHEASADRIKDWVRSNGEEGRKLLHHNPSFVFFREVSHVPAEHGPLGAMNRSITAMRSIAVDPSITKLGAPVWIETDGAQDLRRLMIAQDTGSAIKGAQRADIFFGTGAAAGKRAGTVKEGGRMVVLLPIQRAYAQAEPL